MNIPVYFTGITHDWWKTAGRIRLASTLWLPRALILIPKR